MQSDAIAALPTSTPSGARVDPVKYEQLSRFQHQTGKRCASMISGKQHHLFFSDPVNVNCLQTTAFVVCDYKKKRRNQNDGCFSNRLTFRLGESSLSCANV